MSLTKPEPSSAVPTPPPLVSPAGAPAAASAAAPVDFARFYRGSVSALCRYLARLLGDPVEAQDIAQDAYVKTFEAMRAQPVGQPRAFLFVTARRLALNFRLRRAARMRPAEPQELEARAGTAPDAAAAVMARQEAEAFEAAILALPPGCRAVLVLRMKHGLPHKAIADRLGLAPSTVANQLTRAIRLLRAHLADPAAPGADAGRRRAAGAKSPTPE